MDRFPYPAEHLGQEIPPLGSSTVPKRARFDFPFENVAEFLRDTISTPNRHSTSLSRGVKVNVRLRRYRDPAWSPSLKLGELFICVKGDNVIDNRVGYMDGVDGDAPVTTALCLQGFNYVMHHLELNGGIVDEDGHTENGYPTLRWMRRQFIVAGILENTSASEDGTFTNDPLHQVRVSGRHHDVVNIWSHCGGVEMRNGRYLHILFRRVPIGSSTSYLLGPLGTPYSLSNTRPKTGTRITSVIRAIPYVTEDGVVPPRILRYAEDSSTKIEYGFQRSVGRVVNVAIDRRPDKKIELAPVECFNVATVSGGQGIVVDVNCVTMM